MALDRHNKTTVKHNFAKPGPLVKYEFNKDQYAVEPQFDFGAGSNSAWGLAIKKGLGKNFLKAAYFHKRHEVELEFQHMIKGGPLKVKTPLCLFHPQLSPVLHCLHGSV